MSASRIVYLVRHGDTAMNAATPGPELERGWSDVPLHPMGRKEARRTAVKLARIGIKAIVSSDLKRGTQTAEIIGDWLGIAPDFHAQLRSWNFGQQGKPEGEADRVADRLARQPDCTPSGGESFDDFKRRIFAGLSDTLATHLRNPLAIIVHGRVERLIMAWKACGQKASHAVDVDVFLEKGEQPGHIEAWKVDPATLKLAHDEADFGPGKPSGDRCGKCKAWRGPDDCTKVLPPMDDDDWCAVGVAKSDGHFFEGKGK